MADTFAAKTLRELSRIVFLRVGRILLFVAASTGATYYICWQATPIYRSTVTLLFKQPTGKNPVFQESPERTLEVFVKAQQQIVMSDLVLARTLVLVEDAALRKQWYDLRARWDEIQKKRTPPSEPYDSGTGTKLDAVQNEIESFLTRTSPNGRDRTLADRVAQLMHSKQRELADFRSDVQMKTPGGEQVAMTESFQMLVDRAGSKTAPEGHLRAMNAADVLADMYIVRFREVQQALSGAAGEFMKRIVEEHDKVVQRAQKRLDEFVDHELDAPGDIAILEQLLKSGTEHGFQIIATRAREASLRLRDELAKAQSIRDQLRRLLPEKAFAPDAPEKLPAAEVEKAVAVVPPEVLETNIVINRVTQNVLRVKAKQQSLATQFTEKNRLLAAANEEVERANRLLLADMVSHARSLDVTVHSLEERLKDNEQNLGSIEKRLDKINRKLTEYQRLKNDLTVAQKQHQDIQEEQVNAFQADERARIAITIDKLDNASRPDRDKPIQPLTVIYTWIALGVSLLIAVAAAFLADHFDHTIRTIEQAERYLGLPVIGSVSRRGRTILTST